MSRRTYSHAIEEGIGIFLILLEYSYVLEDLLLDFNALVESNRVLAKEIKDEEVRRLESDVFTSQRATAYSVGFILALLVTRTKRQLVDEVHRRCSLPISHDFRS